MTCPQCQMVLKDGARFCSNCGVSFLSFNTPTELGTTPHMPDPPAETDRLVGQVLDGKYELSARLGAGGMGAVYRARRVHIGDEVAVKVLHPQFVADAQAVERFRREARAAAMLHHPNIVTIYDYGEARGDDAPAYIVMELVQGMSLRELLRNEIRLPPERALALMRDICAGVGAGHRRDICHRDLKPDNVIVLPADADRARETVKVVDFGLAKLRDAAGVPTLTQAGSLMGTPYYMSPEQCQGEALDARSDVYSLGALLYEMLAGGPPFTATSLMGVLTKHMTAAPPPIPAAANVPLALEAVLARALAKDPAARPADAAELARALDTAEAEVRQQRGAEAQRQAADARQRQQAEQAARAAEDERHRRAADAQRQQAAEVERRRREAEEAERQRSAGHATGPITGPVVQPVPSFAPVSVETVMRPGGVRPGPAPGGGTGKWVLAGVGCAAVLVLGVIVLALGGYMAQQTTPDGPVGPSGPSGPSAPSAPAGARVLPAIQAANTTHYVNTRAGRTGKLAENYVGFSFNYPDEWEVDPEPEPSYVRVERQASTGNTIENFSVGWFAATVPAVGNTALLARSVNQLADQVSGNFPGFTKDGEGATTIGPYAGYELRFSGKAAVTYWGRIVVLPNPGLPQKGVTIIMVATEAGDEVTASDEVGLKGELPAILESFRFE